MFSVTHTINETEVTVSISEEGYFSLELDDYLHIKDRAALYLFINKAVVMYEALQPDE